VLSVPLKYLAIVEQYESTKEHANEVIQEFYSPDMNHYLQQLVNRMNSLRLDFEDDAVINALRIAQSQSRGYSLTKETKAAQKVAGRFKAKEHKKEY
jgi:hypothetical protein